MSCNIARQRGPLGSETSIWPCLTASNHEIHEILSYDEDCPPVDLHIRDVGCHELLAQLSLILGALPLVEGGGAKHSPPGHVRNMMKNYKKKITISENHLG